MKRGVAISFDTAECGAWQQSLAQAGPQSGHCISLAAASTIWALVGLSGAQA
jgi:hypothetical protein